MKFNVVVLDPRRLLRSLLLGVSVFSFAVLWIGNATVRVVADDAKPDAGDRQRVIDGVIRNLKEHYVDKDLVQKMADALLAHEKNGDDNVTTDGAAFAELLTRQLRDVSHDMHLGMVYSQDKLPDHPGTPSPESRANYRRALEQENCTFESVKILPHNIGYLKLNSFPDVAFCQSTAVAAMASLNQANAIIFDLRDNRGGYAEMVMLISAYLFDHPEYMYSPREPDGEIVDTVSRAGKQAGGQTGVCSDLRDDVVGRGAVQL
jgi:hypothetical protein